MNIQDTTLCAEVQEANYFRSNPELFGLDELAPDVESSWAMKHAEIATVGVEQHFDKLDDKLSEIIKAVGAATSLVSIASLAVITPENKHIFLAMLFPIIAALWTLNLAIRAKSPSGFALRPSPRKAFEYLIHYQKKSEAAFIGQWEQAYQTNRIAVREKAKDVRRATNWLATAIVLLIIPLLIAIVYPPQAKATVPSSARLVDLKT